MREYERLHDLYKTRSALPAFKYTQQQDLNDLRALLELDLILLVGSDLTWDKPELRTAAALIKAPCAGGEEGQGDDDDDDDDDGGGGGGGGNAATKSNNNNTLALMINHQRQIICVVDGREVSKHVFWNNNCSFS